jgi:hypothetical protein
LAGVVAGAAYGASRLPAAPSRPVPPSVVRHLVGLATQADPFTARASGSSRGGGSGGGSGGGGGGAGGGGGSGGGGSGSYASNKPEAGTGIAPDVQDLDGDSDDGRYDADDDIDDYRDAMDVDDDGNELAPTMRQKATKAGAAQASVLLDRIHLETNVLTPLNLPRPPRSTEDKRKEEERKEAQKRLAEAEETGGTVEAPAPPPPIVSHEVQLRKQMAAEFLDTKDGQSLHVFQFPRTFPTFRKPGDGDLDAKDDVKPDIASRPSREPQNAQEYLAGGWEGFGKRATTKGRPMLGGPGKPSGQIGVLQVLEGGKVRLILGANPDEPDIVYDVRLTIRFARTRVLMRR